MARHKSPETEARETYRIPTEVGFALQSGRPELLAPIIKRLAGGAAKKELPVANEVVSELIRLIGDLMRDLDFERRKFNHLVGEVEECCSEGNFPAVLQMTQGVCRFRTCSGSTLCHSRVNFLLTA